MVRALTICAVLLIFFGVSSAQEFELSAQLPKEIINTCHSATDAGVEMYFNFDVLDTSNEDEDCHPVLGGAVYTSTDGGSGWNSHTATVIGDPGYDSTYEASFTNPASGNVQYYYKVWTDSTVSCWLPNNSSNTFPAPDNKLVQICGDPTGDQDAIILPWDNGSRSYSCTDLVDFWVGYSSSNLFYKMTVAGGGFPYSHTEHVSTGLASWCPNSEVDLDVFHLYTFPIINPNAPYPDSIFYAAIYGDVSISFVVVTVHIWTGVYKVHKLDSTATWIDYLSVYTRLGDIESNVSGNTLSLRVPLSVLTSDSDFGTLDPDLPLATGCGIGTACAFPKDPGCFIYGLCDTFAYSISDGSPSVGMYLKTGEYTVTPSSPPVLSAYGGSAAGGKGVTFYYCTYTDPEGDVPVVHEVVIDGTPYTLNSYGDHTYSDGANFYLVRSDIGSRPTFHFHFSDGANDVTTEDLSLGIEENIPSSGFTLGSAYPNPFNAAVTIPVDAYEDFDNITIDIYNINGEKIRTLHSGYLSRGFHHFIWNGKDASSGLYFVRVRAAGDEQLSRIMLMK